jgi:hypothetical protein
MTIASAHRAQTANLGRGATDEVFEGDWDWATATIRPRSLSTFGDTERPAIYEGPLHLPDGRLVLGDADSEVTLDGLDERTQVRIYGSGEANLRCDRRPSRHGPAGPIRTSRVSTRSAA